MLRQTLSIHLQEANRKGTGMMEGSSFTWAHLGASPQYCRSHSVPSISPTAGASL